MARTSKRTVKTSMAKHRVVQTGKARHPLADDLDPQHEEERFAIGERARRPIREIRVAADSLKVTRKQDGYRYYWARYVSANSINQVDEMTGITVETPDGPMPTWEVVKDKMPEAQERRAADGTRRLGDVMLLRCKLDVFEALQDYEALKRERQIMSVEQPLRAFAQATGHQIGVIGVDLQAPGVRRGLKHGMAQQIAGRQFNEHLRRGTVPGHEVGR